MSREQFAELFALAEIDGFDLDLGQLNACFFSSSSMMLTFQPLGVAAVHISIASSIAVVLKI